LCSFNYSLFFVVYFLVFSVCEGSLGLTILVSIIRSHGNDYFQSYRVLQCKGFFVFFYFLNTFVYVFWVLVIDYFFLFFISFVYLFFSLFFCWSGLGYIFCCDLISYGLILLSLWICVLMILARDSIFRLGYFSELFLFVVIILTIILYCTFRRIGLLTFYIFLRVD